MSGSEAGEGRRFSSKKKDKILGVDELDEWLVPGRRQTCGDGDVARKKEPVGSGTQDEQLL